MRYLLHASVCAVAICAASGVHAQETTSSIRGVVTSGDSPVSGAAITVTHVPSGTKSTTVTGADGSFDASGLRVGGPYTIKVAADGFVDTTITDIDLTAGQSFRVPIALEATGQDIVVTAKASGAIDLSPGPGSGYNREKIEGVASVTRDIRDIVRRDPFATIDPAQSRGVMIAGQNARLNKFSVDGLRFSDTFGLNVGGLPTARGPVPLDAIEQLSVKIAPFDISEGDFQGGAVNLVLRSGTNKITGSGFYSYTSDGLTGSKTRPGIANATGIVKLDFESKNYGGFLSGPIIKDKLFVALSYEHLAEGAPINIGTAGFPNVVPNLTDAQVANISSLAKTVYNYDTLGVQSSTLETDEKYTAKIDWNITEGQRLSFTYIHDDSANTSTAGFSSTSTLSPALALGSNNYKRPEKVSSYVGQLNSDWADNFHTELRGNFRKYDLTPVPFGAIPFSQMQVCLDPASQAADPTNPASPVSTAVNTNSQACSPNTARIYFGPDRFRHFNYVRTQQYGADIAARWNLGAIAMKLTAAYEHFDVANAFTSDAYGTYYFDSLADFQAKRAGSVTLAGSTTGNISDVLASFKYNQFTVGLQGSWDPTPTLSVTAGTRVDFYGMKDRPPVNQYFLQRYGFANSSVIEGKIVPQPRLSATWSPSSRLRLRGGFGLFAGGSPDVFLGNSFSVAGVYQNSITITRAANGSCVTPTPAICNAALNGVTGTGFSPLVTDYLKTNVGSISVANVNAMDPHYEMESTWKATLSADYKANLGFLGSGWNFGGDFYYGFVNNAPIYYDLRLVANGTLPDGRPRYAPMPLVPTNSNTDLLLTNTHKGHSLVSVARFDKGWDWGLTIGGSYTFQDVTDVSSMNGTTASGTYGQNAAVDPNKAAYGTSIYQIRNSWKFTIDYDHAFFGDNKTRFSMFGELRSGIPYSITMNDPTLSNGHSVVFGTAGSANRYLLYVPLANDPLIANAANDPTLVALNAFIDANGLSKYRGSILPKNTQRAPSWFKIDLHVDQEIPLPLVSGAKFKIFADLENVLNLINKDWGSLRQVSFPYLAPVVNVSCVAVGANSCGQYRYANFSNPAVDNQSRYSLWGLRIGAKLQF